MWSLETLYFACLVYFSLVYVVSVDSLLILTLVRSLLTLADVQRVLAETQAAFDSVALLQAAQIAERVVRQGTLIRYLLTSSW
jgi:hypothetical protein